MKEKVSVSAGLTRSLAIVADCRCDAKGNIYFHPAKEAPANPLSGPLVRIAADGRRVVTISLESVPDVPSDAVISNFALGLRGEVHILVYERDGLHLIHFDDEGSFRSDTKLDAEFNVSHLAVFPTGELIAAGKKLAKEGNGELGTPFTAIFDRNGKLIKELSFAGDVKPQTTARPEEQAAAIDLGSAVPADDGNIYLLRASATPLIFVISPSGELVRKLTLSPPDNQLNSAYFTVAGGKIFMGFFKPSHDERNSGAYMYSLYDATTGERQLDFATTPEAEGIFACYTPDQFTFLRPEGDGLYLIHAVPR